MVRRLKSDIAPYPKSAITGSHDLASSCVTKCQEQQYARHQPGEGDRGPIFLRRAQLHGGWLIVHDDATPRGFCGLWSRISQAGSNVDWRRYWPPTWRANRGSWGSTRSAPLAFYVNTAPSPMGWWRSMAGVSSRPQATAFCLSFPWWSMRLNARLPCRRRWQSAMTASQLQGKTCRLEAGRPRARRSLRP